MRSHSVEQRATSIVGAAPRGHVDSVTPLRERASCDEKRDIAVCHEHGVLRQLTVLFANQLRGDVNLKPAEEARHEHEIGRATGEPHAVAERRGVVQRS